MRSSSTCGARRSIACAAIGLPRNACSPLSTPPMRLPCPPASTIPVTSIIGEGMERGPRRALAGKRVARGRAIHRSHEEGERQVDLTRPVLALRFEGEARAAMGAELAPRALGRNVVAHQLLALGKAHLRALESHPRHPP